MRTSATFNNIYLALLVVELGVITYDGLFADPTLGQWVRITILALGIAGFYSWSRGLWLSRRWVWLLLFVLVCGWFFVYLPLEIYGQWDTFKKMVNDFGLSVLALVYLVFFAFHIPLFYALYSAAFDRPADTTRHGSKNRGRPNSHLVN